MISTGTPTAWYSDVNVSGLSIVKIITIHRHILKITCYEETNNVRIGS